MQQNLPPLGQLLAGGGWGDFRRLPAPLALVRPGRPDHEPGMYRFMDTAYWREEGVLQTSGDGFTYVSIGEKTLLPLIYKNH